MRPSTHNNRVKCQPFDLLHTTEWMSDPRVSVAKYGLTLLLTPTRRWVESVGPGRDSLPGSPSPPSDTAALPPGPFTSRPPPTTVTLDGSSLAPVFPDPPELPSLSSLPLLLRPILVRGLDFGPSLEELSGMRNMSSPLTPGGSVLLFKQILVSRTVSGSVLDTVSRGSDKDLLGPWSGCPG